MIGPVRLDGPNLGVPIYLASTAFSGSCGTDCHNDIIIIHIDIIVKIYFVKYFYLYTII